MPIPGTNIVQRAQVMRFSDTLRGVGVIVNCMVKAKVYLTDRCRNYCV